MRTKILYLITKSNWGGAQRYVYDLATNLPESFEPVVASGGDGLLMKKLSEKSVRTISIPYLERDISLGKEISALSTLLRILKKEKPDILHINSSKAGGLGTLAGRIAGIKKIVFTVHGWPFLEKRNILARALIYTLSWLTALLSHTVIVVSEYDLRIAKKMPFVGQKTVRIYNGIETPVLGSSAIIRDSFPNGVRITGTIGELNKNKNQIALIEQAKNKPDMYVAIVGEGENKQLLVGKISEYGLSDRVKLFGFLSANEILKGFDTFALPSLKEGLPYVLLEAKAVGLPIVANRVGGVGEILDAKDMSEFTLSHMMKQTLALYSAK